MSCDMSECPHPPPLLHPPDATEESHKACSYLHLSEGRAWAQVFSGMQCAPGVGSDFGVALGPLQQVQGRHAAIICGIDGLPLCLAPAAGCSHREHKGALSQVLQDYSAIGRAACGIDGLLLRLASACSMLHSM